VKGGKRERVDRRTDSRWIGWLAGGGNCARGIRSAGDDGPSSDAAVEANRREASLMQRAVYIRNRVSKVSSRCPVLRPPAFARNHKQGENARAGMHADAHCWALDAHPCLPASMPLLVHRRTANSEPSIVPFPSSPSPRRSLRVLLTAGGKKHSKAQEGSSKGGRPEVPKGGGHQRGGGRITEREGCRVPHPPPSPASCGVGVGPCADGWCLRRQMSSVDFCTYVCRCRLPAALRLISFCLN
jgi:hypothetical protein